MFWTFCFGEKFMDAPCWTSIEKNEQSLFFRRGWKKTWSEGGKFKNHWQEDKDCIERGAFREDKWLKKETKAANIMVSFLCSKDSVLGNNIKGTLRRQAGRTVHMPQRTIVTFHYAWGICQKTKVKFVLKIHIQENRLSLNILFWWIQKQIRFSFQLKKQNYSIRNLEIK